MTETDVIGHLLDVEQQAAEMLLDAQVEADHRVEQARSAADADYKIQYEKLVSDLEKKYETKLKAVEDEHSVVMKEYKASIDNMKTDKVSFNALMDKLLFAE